jgi:hypothetical protein
MKLTQLRVSRKAAFSILAVVLLADIARAGQTNFPPRLGPPTLLKNGSIQFVIFNGRWHQTNVVEASTDLVRWTPMRTNVFPETLCPMCPFIVFQDFATNSVRRFYRARNF